MSTEVCETDFMRKADKQFIRQLSQPLTSAASILDLKAGLEMCVRPSKLEGLMDLVGQIPLDFPVKWNAPIQMWVCECWCEVSDILQFFRLLSYIVDIFH